MISMINNERIYKTRLSQRIFYSTFFGCLLSWPLMSLMTWTTSGDLFDSLGGMILLIALFFFYGINIVFTSLTVTENWFRKSSYTGCQETFFEKISTIKRADSFCLMGRRGLSNRLWYKEE